MGKPNSGIDRGELRSTLSLVGSWRSSRQHQWRGTRAKWSDLHTWIHRRGQKPTICTREEQYEGRRGQKGWICTRGLKLEGITGLRRVTLDTIACSMRQTWRLRCVTLVLCHADRRAAAAELTPLRCVRPSYRLLRPRCRENLYPAGTSHFPRPWGGHVRRGTPPVRRLTVIVLYIPWSL